MSVGATAATAIEDLALLVADAYACGAVTGVPAQLTSVRLVYARPATDKIRHRSPEQRADEHFAGGDAAA